MQGGELVYLPGELFVLGLDVGGGLGHPFRQLGIEALQFLVGMVDLAALLLDQRLGLLARAALVFQTTLEPLKVGHGSIPLVQGLLG